MFSLFQNLPIPPLAGFWFREGASNFAPEIDGLYMLILWISIAFFVLIVGAMILFVWMYRMRPGHTEKPSPSHNNTIEIIWTVIPTLIVMLIFFLGFWGFLKMSNPPADAIEIGVVAQKWNWDFQYPGGVTDPNLHVWKGQSFKLVQSSKDVLHSLYVPAFRIKMDCVPGRYTYQWFEVTKLPEPDDDDNNDNAGRMSDGSDQPVGYDLFCTEYCGTGHSTMAAKVIVYETKAEWQVWYDKAANIFEGDDGAPRPLEEVGEILYLKKGCANCHSIDGTAKVGPSFAETSAKWGGEVGTDKGNVVVDDNYVRESILYPNAKYRAGYKPGMPSYLGQLKDTKERPEIDALIAFIKSLKDE